MSDNGRVPRPLPADLSPRLPSPLTEIDDDRFARHGVRVLLKRDDLIHPDLIGNKWRKLASNLEAAGDRPLVTFGGAYSNHLRATAAAGRLLGIPTTGIVRGDELAGRPLNPSLTRCAEDGMRLRFVDRSTYRRKDDPATLTALLEAADAQDAYVVPEGGSNALAVRGCVALGRELRGRADVVAVPCGTGGTLAGLAAGLSGDQRALGVAVLKGGFLTAEVRALQEAAFGGVRGDWQVADGFHFGGYARVPAELRAFADDFGQRHGLAVEHLYVAKMLHALVELARSGAFPAGTTIAAVVTGTPH
ncbi:MULTISPECIES: pyridoxal-phosphate dependent enzyme [unclassified Streptomyces]|uniref:1-aminocyclopropane-1-carboxylate deaminase/D-cysteine desulfhydrase n=1 Tax=unclassified Streptomyces TaxID=2593676 RepID=UPI000DBA7A91|nr:MULTISPECIES: pyridoxal-phosphate dependent enzyme [unclassified Streptomyces]MYT75867.1 pyridoxal-phosphate dependent enzyme [Streptomyces sp. SID8367]RAJ77695.1 1-aminocyclopropane-1-carboxylate deaminase [Streptomyces sp. PsTaAH-137]